MLHLSVKTKRILAVAWLLFISVLFFLPGSALPKEAWLDQIHFDKWVHVGLFVFLLFLWRFYFPAEARVNGLLLLFAFCYGMGVEIIQHYFVANRSFDLGDVLADMTGAAAGLWLWMKVYIKK